MDGPAGNPKRASEDLASLADGVISLSLINWTPQNSFEAKAATYLFDINHIDEVVGGLWFRAGFNYSFAKNIRRKCRC